MIWATPQFWYQKGHWLAWLLWPFSIIYLVIGIIIKFVKRPRQINTQVVTFGNAVVGGSGKTPVVIAIIDALIKCRIKPQILMRGYGGTHKYPHQVNLNCDTSQAVGDEALIMSRYAPTWVSRNRYQGALICQNSNPDIIISDDGLQNHDLKAEVSIMVINGMQDCGNGYLFPAGPLREPFHPLLKRCDGAILIDGSPEQFQRLSLHKTPVWQATTQPNMDLINQLKNHKIFAFSGLGFNDKFFSMLRSQDLNVIHTKAFPDHYHYTHSDLETMLITAQEHHAVLVTTEKDWCRLGAEWQNRVIKVPITIDIHNITTLIECIKPKKKLC